MQITEARLYSFGKLQNRNFGFKPGINVVYGVNESGKSTLHAFLVAMLFGMEKNRGRANMAEGYLRYEPWHAPAYYSGALRFCVSGRPFYLERNFYHREKRELLRNEADGEELSVAYGDLGVLLGGIGKEVFGNTYDIPQCGAVTGTELAKVLTEYLSDASGSGDGGTHITRAQGLLETKRKELNADLRKKQERREQERAALLVEQELLERDCVQLRGELAEERRELERAERGGHEKAAPQNLQERNKGTESSTNAETHMEMQVGWRGWLGAGILLAGALLNWGIYRMSGYPRMWFVVIECLLSAGACAGMLPSIRGRMKSRRPIGREGQRMEAKGRQVETAVQQVDMAGQQLQQLLAKRNDTLWEKETRLYNISEQLEKLEMPGETERELLTDIRALQLASAEIARLAKEFCEETEDELNSEVSRYVSAITGGSYDSVRVDDKGGLRVHTEGKEVPPDALSRGTLEQFYLAFRLAVGSIVTKEEPMPIFLDETFALYDDARLERVLKLLAGMEEQVIIFTCQKRELKLLEQLGIPHHRVMLGE